MTTNEHILKILDAYAVADDKTLMHYLTILIDNQTSDERTCNSTIEKNGLGFNKADAPRATRIYKNYHNGYIDDNFKLVTGQLREYEREYLCKILMKYVNQY